MNPCTLLLAVIALVPQGVHYAKPKMEIAKIPIIGKKAATLRLPRLQTRSPLCDLAEKAVADAEKRGVAAWVTEERELLRVSPDAAKNMGCESNTVLKFDDPKALSFRSESQHYNGVGAHGMTNRRTYNFGFVAGKPARFGISEAFLRDKPTRVLLQELLVGRAGQMEGAEWIAEGAVKYLSDAQLNRFWIDRDALVWEFDPYELGPYAVGAFVVRVPKAEVSKLIRSDGPLGFWAAR